MDGLSYIGCVHVVVIRISILYVANVHLQQKIIQAVLWNLMRRMI